MRKCLLHTMIIAMIAILSGCSVYLPRNVAVRAPAQVPSEYFNTAFTFPASEKTELVDYTDLVKKTIDQYAPNFNSFDDNVGYKFEFITKNDLINSSAYLVEMDVDQYNEQPTYRIYHTTLALQDRVATQSMLDFIGNLNWVNPNDKTPKNAYFDLYFKARSGDLAALDVFLKIRRIQPEFNNGLDKDIYQTEDYQKNLALINNAREQVSDEMRLQKNPKKKK